MSKSLTEPQEKSWKGNFILYPKLAGILSLVFFGWLFLNGPMGSSCWSSQLKPEEKKFSLHVKDKPLREVVEQMAEATGCEIIVNSEGAGFPVTVDLDDVTLHEGLKNLIKSLENPNYAMIVHEGGEKIEIAILHSSSSGQGESSTEEEWQTDNAEHEFPTEYPAAIPALQQEEINPADLEVIPPETPGERGVTEQEIKESQRLQEETDPQDVEIIPPEHPGERGITEGEIKESQNFQEETTFQDSEATPPEDSEVDPPED